MKTLWTNVMLTNKISLEEVEFMQGETFKNNELLEYKNRIVKMKNSIRNKIETVCQKQDKKTKESTKKRKNHKAQYPNKKKLRTKIKSNK